MVLQRFYDAVHKNNAEKERLIKAIIEEYRDCPDELDIDKVVKQVMEMAQEDPCKTE